MEALLIHKRKKERKICLATLLKKCHAMDAEFSLTRSMYHGLDSARFNLLGDCHRSEKEQGHNTDLGFPRNVLRCLPWCIEEQLGMNTAGSSSVSASEFSPVRVGACFAMHCQYSEFSHLPQSFVARAIVYSWNKSAIFGYSCPGNTPYPLC